MDKNENVMDRPSGLEPTSAPDLPPWVTPEPGQEMAYIGICRTCHKIVFVSVDDEKWKEDVARCIQSMILDGGYYIKHETVEDTRRLVGQMWGCTCEAKQKELGI